MNDIEILKWDSDFFDMRIARFDLSKNSNIQDILNTLQSQNIQLAYVFEPEDLHIVNHKILQAFKGVLSDKKITFRKELYHHNQVKKSPNIRINFYTTTNSKLEELAIISGNYSRFKTDPNISDSLFRRFYKTWIRNSINKSIADYVISYHEKDELLGYVTLKIDEKIGKIGIIAVIDSLQGKGIGTQLLNQTYTICTEHYIKELEVVTQLDNKRACQFYLNNGFAKLKMERVYHFWL